MDSASSEDICQAISEKGYWVLIDPVTGGRVDETLKNGFNFQTVEALDLCKVSTFNNEKIRSVVINSIKQPVLGFYRAFGQTRLDHCFLNNTHPSTPEMSILALSLCSSNTNMILHQGSHLHELNATGARNGLLAISDGRLQELGITQELVELEHGGYVLVDGRLGWKVLKGKVAFLGVMVPDEAKHWHLMPLPKTEPFVKKVGEMERESDTFCRNFTWEEPASEDRQL